MRPLTLLVRIKIQLRGVAMGEFVKKVRYGNIAGPSQRNFKREEWIKRKDDSSLDDDDRRVVWAGLFLDDILSFLRKQIHLSDIDLCPEALVRLTIGLATHNLFQLHEHTRIARPKRGARAELDIPSILATTVEADGQAFAPDELITGSGDGMKHMFRQLVGAEVGADRRKEHEVNREDLDNINAELNKAIMYHCAVEYWHDCLGHEYGIARHEEGLVIEPSRPDLEIARVVSIYRRLNISLQDDLMVGEWWLHKWPRAVKEKLCDIPLVRRIYGSERIERIELGIDGKVLDAAVLGVAAMISLQYGYYQGFLDEPLPKLKEFTLNQVITGWRLLQSLAVVIVDSLKRAADDNPRDLLRFAPRISRKVLRSTFAKALSIGAERAEQLIEVFVFEGDASEELWYQPLMRIGEDYCLVAPCIHSVQLQRIVEGWMRQGGLDLDRRGPEFEKFCRDELARHAKDSPIAQSLAILDRAVEFTPAGGRREEIDIVVLIGDTVLLVEAKCILWPDDSLQFSNYRDTVEKAVAQISRKKDAVLSDYPAFARRLRELGHVAPDKGDVVCCVLTNSAVYSGFPIDGVPVVDLPILGRYLKNKYVKVQSYHAGESTYQHVLHFYDDATQAGTRLGSYLSNPPQLSDTKQFVRHRDLFFPIESQEFGRLVKRTYKVEIDSEEMKIRYGLRADPLLEATAPASS